jgi:hypothetical protein
MSPNTYVIARRLRLLCMVYIWLRYFLEAYEGVEASD